MKRMIGFATIMAASLVWGVASAQTASSFETDNRAKALGELTDEQVAEALANDGRVAMSGEFFNTDRATLSESRGMYARYNGAMNTAIAAPMMLNRECPRASRFAA